MDTLLLVAITFALAYALGSVPFGYLVGRWRGVDVLQHGSRNIGATNVGRLLGKPYGVLVFALDFAKGAVPVALANIAAQQFQPTAAAYLGVLAGAAAFLGHLYSPWLGFGGGKGVATGAGVVLVLVPVAALGAFGVWVVTLAAFRYVSLASLAAALALCAIHLAATPEPYGDAALAKTLFCDLAAALVVYRHRANLGRLTQGTENRSGETTAMQLLGKTLHVLAIGLWFGSAIFFTFVVGLTLFGQFEALAESRERPPWFPLWYFSEPDTLKEQGTRAAGFAISPMFDIYYLLQGICGFIVVMTALAWTRAEGGRRVHTLRVWVVGMALVTVVAGWPIARHVSDLRAERNWARDVYLLESSRPTKGEGRITTAESIAKARDASEVARGQFGQWHTISLLGNFVTVLLVTVGTALAAQLPPTIKPVAPTPKPAEQAPTPLT